MGLIKCFICLKEFERKNSEINRNNKKGRKSFCSRLCAGKYCIRNIPEDKRILHKNNLRKGSERDEYSPFRFFYKLCKLRVKQKPSLELDLTLEDLKNQWLKQKGICPYTGWPMVISPCQSRDKLEKTPHRASLDRIDSKKGYIKGNIQFICLIAQYAKNSWDGNVIFEFAEAVKKYNN